MKAFYKHRFYRHDARVLHTARDHQLQPPINAGSPWGYAHASSLSRQLAPHLKLNSMNLAERYNLDSLCGAVRAMRGVACADAQHRVGASHHLGYTLRCDDKVSQPTVSV